MGDESKSKGPVLIRNAWTGSRMNSAPSAPSALPGPRLLSLLWCSGALVPSSISFLLSGGGASDWLTQPHIFPRFALETSVGARRGKWHRELLKREPLPPAFFYLQCKEY